MSNLVVPIEIGAYALGIIGAIAGVYGFFRYADYKNTVQLQNDSIKALQENNTILKNEIENSKKARVILDQQITVLTNEVMTYKNLQLEKIATALTANSELLGTLAKSNEQILSTLKSSAIIAATDRGVLTSVGSNTQNVQEQTVEHQTVKSV